VHEPNADELLKPELFDHQRHEVVEPLLVDRLLLRKAAKAPREFVAQLLELGVEAGESAVRSRQVAT